MPQKKLSRGTYGVLLTPFTAERELDIALLEKELFFCDESTMTGVLALGSTGEFPYLTLEQRKTVLRLTKEIVQTKKELIAGVSGYTEYEVIENLKMSHNLGYTHAIVCPPYYYPQSQHEVLNFFKTISSSTPKGMDIILYNIPFCTAGISLQTLEELCEYKNIVGLKDSSGEGLYMAKAIQIVNKSREDFSYFTGQDALLLSSLSIGGSGCMSALSWILHAEMQKIIKLFDNVKTQDAMRLQSMINDLVMHLDSIPFPENYRSLAAVNGIDCGIAQRKYDVLLGEREEQWRKEAGRKIRGIKSMYGL